MEGKLIVIDGTDGSGKATQAKLLHDRLEREGKQVATLDFPRYTENFFGKFIRECLDGEYGNFLEVHPKIASVLYASDRFESVERISRWLEAGTTVILDRYVSANMIHQGAKFTDEIKLTDFLAWLDEMEHGVYKIPRPDIIIYLDVPYAIRKELVSKDTSRKVADFVEQDDVHQLASEKCAQKVASLSKGWHTVLCTHEGMLRTREDIHEDVHTIVQAIL